MDVDVEHQIVILGCSAVQLANVRTVVIPKDFRVLQELPTTDTLLEIRARDEKVVHAVAFVPTRITGGVGHRRNAAWALAASTH